MHAQQDWGLERSRKILFDYNSVGLKKKLKNFLVNYAENNMAGLICHIIHPGVGRARQIITKWQVNHSSEVAFRKCPSRGVLIRKGRKYSTSNVKIAARCFLCIQDFSEFSD